MSENRIRQCERCGAEFRVDTWAARNGRGRWCTRECKESRTTADLFWLKVDKSGPCWIWMGALGSQGYGAFRVRELGRTQKAHRVAWWLHHGSWPDLFVCHRCDNPRCVNPGHLFLGTHTENMADMISKGRARHDSNPRGVAHPSSRLTEENVREIRRRRKNGETLTALGKEFGVTHKSIHAVVARRSWKHVA